MSKSIIKKSYFHDVEIAPNYFSDIFIDVKTDPKLIDDYIQADINKDYKAKKLALNAMNPHVFIIHNNDASSLIKLVAFLNNNVQYLVSFNGLHYDDVILKFIVSQGIRYSKNEDLNGALYRLSQEVINTDNIWNSPTLSKLAYTKVKFQSLDVFAILFSNSQRKSLKQTLIKSNWYRIEDLPFKYDMPILRENIPNVLDYEINDILGLRHIYNLSKGEIALRFKLTERYQRNMINKSRSGIADALFYKFYMEDNPDVTYDMLKSDAFRTYRDWINVGECIDKSINFKGLKIKFYKNTAKKGRKDNFIPLYINDLNEFVELLRKVKVRSTNEIKYRFAIDGQFFDIKSGGIHSVDEPGIFEEDDKYYYIDADVGSFYPYVMVQLKVKPEHLNSNFTLRIEKVAADRIKAKKLKDTVEADGLKIAINAWFGKLISIYGPLFDMKAGITVTINGELLMSSLIEDLSIAEKGFKVISANTDGIVTRVPKDKLDDYYKVCKDWEDRTKFNLEYKFYSKYIRKDVNNYTTISQGINYNDIKDLPELEYKKYVKCKGIFDADNMDLTKGFSPSIIPIALRHYFYGGIPIEETINNCKDIYYFCMSQKINTDSFNPIYKELSKGEFEEIELQKNNRFFASLDGGYLFKEYKPVYDYTTEEFVPPHTERIDKKTGAKIITIKKPTAILKKQKITVFNDFYKVKSFEEYKVDYNFYIKQCREIIEVIQPSNPKSLFDFN